jgi:leucyl-tRNA synthetase
VQVNGKVRDRLTVKASVNETEAKQLALTSLKVKAYIKDKETVNIIYVPGKLINIVIK